MNWRKCTLNSVLSFALPGNLPHLDHHNLVLKYHVFINVSLPLSISTITRDEVTHLHLKQHCTACNRDECAGQLILIRISLQLANCMHLNRFDCNAKVMKLKILSLVTTRL